jgi:hypothetical protein
MLRRPAGLPKATGRRGSPPLTGHHRCSLGAALQSQLLGRVWPLALCDDLEGAG